MNHKTPRFFSLNTRLEVVCMAMKSGIAVLAATSILICLEAVHLLSAAALCFMYMIFFSGYLYTRGYYARVRDYIRIRPVLAYYFSVIVMSSAYVGYLLFR